MYEGLIQQEAFYNVDKQSSFLLPIPLHKKRLRERGYNQSEIMAIDLGIRLGLPIKKLLIRQVKTERQVGKTQKERRENVKGAFSIVEGSGITGKTIFLIDDVVTSGSTMNEAAKLLKRNGAKAVYGLALAHGL